MSLAQNGMTDIYEMDMRTQAINRLTQSASIDTSPSYSPDGSKIVFNSDRGGSQQLYVMDADGSELISDIPKSFLKIVAIFGTTLKSEPHAKPCLFR